jgi:protein-tyrosine-phosphatase
LDDLKPGLKESTRLLVGYAGKAASKSKNLLFSLEPARRLYTARVRRKLKMARTVLFLCKGNICRSPFAELYARGLASGNHEILSSGYYPKQGRACPQAAVEAAKRLGFDLTGHRSTVITAERMRQADMILVFDEEGWRTVGSSYAFAKKKTYRVDFLAPGHTITTRDPYGKTTSAFETVYQSIIRAVDSVMG